METLMLTPSIATVVKMLEDLPEETQSQVVEHLRQWLAELEEEAQWEQSFARSQDKLYQAGHEARKQIAKGKSKPLDLNEL
jgi:hypothetical protein